VCHEDQSLQVMEQEAQTEMSVTLTWVYF
jgi:hypothetical protein